MCLTRIGSIHHRRVASVPFHWNQALEITDGETTLLTDFPYQSGAFGYMAYPDGELHPRSNALCLITHRHLDHFDPSLVKKVGCTLVAPKEVTSKLPGVPSLDLKEGVRFGPIRIHPVRTPHRDLEHYSYLVTWQGRRLYFVGDTTSTRRSSQRRIWTFSSSPHGSPRTRCGRQGSYPVIRK